VFYRGNKQRGPIYYEYKGVKKTAREWAYELGLTKVGFKSRWQRHMGNPKRYSIDWVFGDFKYKEGRPKK
jgi:hypothetical protein